MANKDTYQVLYRGFDCLVSPKEEGTFDVSLFEGGAHVFTTNIAMDMSQFETEDELDDNSEALIDEAAQAAVDQYEASRGTLGQGAGATQKAGTMEKKAYFHTLDREEWFLNLKGTPYEAQAVSLLEQYVAAWRTVPDSSKIDQLRAQSGQIAYELDMLNIKRLQQARPNETIIVIRGSVTACSYVEDFTDRFRGHPNEGIVLKKVKEYLDLQSQIDAVYKEQDSVWDKTDEILKAMDELLVTALQSEVDSAIVETGGMNLAPNMAADVAELMEGVTFDTPIEPQHELPPALFAKKSRSEWEDEPEPRKDEVFAEALDMAKTMKRSTPDQVKKTLMYVYGLDAQDADYVLQMRAAKKADKNEDKPGDEHPLVELGAVHEGKDVAEVPLDDMPFQIGDSVTLTKAYELALWGGATDELPKGMKGKIKNLYDGHGDAYMVECEEGGVYRIPTEYLK